MWIVIEKLLEKRAKPHDPHSQTDYIFCLAVMPC